MVMMKIHLSNLMINMASILPAFIPLAAVFLALLVAYQADDAR